MYNQIYSILREAGDIMLSAKNIETGVEEKDGSVNLVTTYDVKIQNFLQEKLLCLYPDAHFMGEENPRNVAILEGKTFIVDPIDGTANFVRHLDASAISVALLQDTEVILGATYNPYRNQFFYAEKGKGATCNGTPIHVSTAPLSESIVSFGTSPYYKELHPKTFDLGYRLLCSGLDIRRSGSAVIDLCETAQGHLDLFCELKLSPWDYAASSLIITEAGGTVSQMNGLPLVFDRPCSVVAGSAKAYKDFFTL